MLIDRIDQQILKLLLNNARITNKSLAQKIGVAPSTCFERVRILQEKGIIKGFHAEIDFEKINLGLKAMVSVKLKTHSRIELNRFHEHINQLDYVIAVYHTSGSMDFLMQVEMRDTAHLQSFILDQLSNRTEVAQIETSLIYDKKRRYDFPPMDIK